MQRIALVIVFVLALGAAFAQISQSLVGADTLTVGSRFELIVKGSFPIKRVVVPDSLDGFVVIRQDILGKGSTKPYSKLTIAPLKPGSLSFPAMKVLADNADNGDYHTDAFRIKVLTVRAEQDSLLRDIKPLNKYPFQIPFWLYWFVFIPLLVWFVVCLILYLRARMASKVPTREIKEEKAPLADWEQALQELAELHATEPQTPEEMREYHYRLAMILRVFLERHYRIQAVEMTSFEIRSALRELHLSRIPEILQFLAYCDRVKFAKHMPEMSEIESFVGWLREYLLSHKPVAKETTTMQEAT